MPGYDRINYMQYPMPWMNTDYSFNSPCYSPTTSFSGWNSQYPSFYPNFTNGMYNSFNWDMNSVWNNYGITPQPTFTSAPTATQKAELTANLTEEQRTAMIEDNKEQLAKQNRKAQGGLGAAMFGSLALAPVMDKSIARSFHATRNQPVTEMFFTTESAKLWESHPTTMTEAQKVMQKSQKQYQKELTKLTKTLKGEELTKAIGELETNYNKYIKNMKDAITNGADDVARVTQHYKAGNGKWYERAPKVTEKTGKYWDSVIKTGNESLSAELAGKTPVAAKAVKGNSFLRHAGGVTGIIMGGVFGFANYFSEEEIAKRQEAKKIAEETGDKSIYRKQVRQSLAKSFLPSLSWVLGDAGGKWLVNRCISKKAGKIAIKLASTETTKLGGWFAKKAGAKVIGKACGKIAGKLTGKAIGAAIGSIVPGLGTIVGMAIGAVADWALRKYVVPAIFGKNDAVDEKKIESATNEDLLTAAYVSKMSGEKISAEAEAALAGNPTFCAKLHEQLLAEQQAQGYVA